ncbi:MAG: DUF1810 family protein, partial [Pseudomonadota bacterium]
RRVGERRTTSSESVFCLGGLGLSAMSQRYAISSLAEAKAYLAPLLGDRLVSCTSLVLDTEGHTAHEIFGSPDDMKLKSCMTLFARAASDPAHFNQALAKYYDGQEDPTTVELLEERNR